MPATDTPPKNVPHPKIHQQRIGLVAGAILIAVTLLVGVTVFIIMLRHAEELLSKSLQLSLQNRVQLIQTEIGAGFDRTMVVATRPLLIDQMQRMNAGADEGTGRMALNTAVQSFLSTGISAIALLDKDGQELVRAGSFAQKPTLTVPVNLPGRVQLMWDGKLLLHVVVDMKQAGRVVGQVIAEAVLPVTTAALKDANLLGETGELALCAPFGLKMQCFPTTRNPAIFTLFKRSPQGVPLPMTHALEGATGLTTAHDYRNQKVVAAYAPVGDLGLGMVLKIDSAELYAPVWMQLRYLIPLLAGVLVIALLLLRWLLTPLVARLVRSEAQAHAMSASLRDSEHHARGSETQLRQITDTVPALIAYLDLEQRFRFHNKAYEEVFGLSSEQINGHTLAEVLGHAAYGGIRDKVEEVLQGYVVRYERIQRTEQGDIRNYAMHYFPSYGEGADEGKVLGFFSLGTDITELKRIDRMKTEFISTVSHELRTPLTSIRGSLGLIASGVAGELPETVKTLVGIANNNCERLIRLINDILDSEKIESGKMRLDLQVVNVRQVVQQTLSAIEGFARQHRVKVLLEAPEASLKVRIDSDRMTQVLTNLLSNAVKFSPPEGAVEVRVSRVAQKVRIEVADHGPGIPEEFRGRIFQKFSQADSSDTRQKGGTGLGLNISRSLIEKMGGQIGFSSEAGAGTTFFLELPEWQNPVPLLQPVRTQAVSYRPRILVCEGDADVARLISMMLGKAGFDADIAHHATQARARLESNNYDAVTVDLKLSGQSGAAFISELRGNERTRNLPVVVISAMAEEGRLQFNRKPLTVSGWLEKPIDENLLILSVRRAVAGLESGKPRILHVEDDPDIQRVVAAIARDFAIFEFAATLDEARARLREHRFDLVLLDLALGEDSGWDLVDDIDALDPRPPVIVFSASDVYPAEGKQAEAVLVKARTSNTELLNTIQRVLQIPGDPGPTRPQSLS